MTLAAALSLLYAVSGMLSCACYGPQLLDLARKAEARRAMSLASWGGWLAVSTVNLAYATLVVHQPEMILVTTLGALCQATVVFFVAGQRLRDRRQTKRAGPPAGPAPSAV
ncbi:MAG TPA: hypothetical protein VL974_01600 [Magnetospirillum sp.]|jgi:hypothetical protein|nr:hypothetical protein [Magnetospirillum sp.]